MSLRRGGPSPDSLLGTDGHDVLFGRGGADRLDGLAGDDALFGGPGRDSLFGGAGNDFVSGGAGNDSIVGDAAGGGPNPPHYGGTPGRNLLLGGGGDDLIRGGYGQDTAFGGAGDDTIIGWGYGPGSPSGAKAFERFDAADLLLGGAGRDSIAGGGGNDTLNGGCGDDTLQGGFDVDRLTGGPGADRFLFRREGAAGETLDSGVGPGHRDVVTDFRHVEHDLLDPSGYRSIFMPRDTPPPIFIGREAFRVDPEDGNRMQVRIEVEDDRTIVQVYSQFNLPPPGYPRPEPVVSAELELRGVHGIGADDLFLG